MPRCEILLIEDDRGDVRLIREVIRTCDWCDLTVTPSVSAAQSLVESKTFDLMILDFGNNEFGSAAFIKSVRAKTATPIVVFTGSPEVDLAYEAGANAFVSKRMDLDEFLKSVKDIVIFWTQVVRLPRQAEAALAAVNR